MDGHLSSNEIYASSNLAGRTIKEPNKMSKKKKLRKKLHKQRITHLLAVSDLNIELDKVKYALTFAEARASQLKFENDMLSEMVERLAKEPANEEQKASQSELPC